MILLSRHTVTTSLQVAAHHAVVTNLDQVHFNVMSQEYASAETTPWVKSATYVNGDFLGFLMLHAKVRNCLYCLLNKCILIDIQRQMKGSPLKIPMVFCSDCGKIPYLLWSHLQKKIHFWDIFVKPPMVVTLGFSSIL